jgi:hypothetical protein
MRVRLFAQQAAVLATLLLVSGSAAGAVTYQAAVNCAFSADAGDDVSRGFYVTNYGATNLGEVELLYSASVDGFYRVVLEAHRGSFDGPLIGSPQIATPFVVSTSQTFTLFDFNGAPVTPGDTIAFTQTYQQISGGTTGSLTYNIGSPGQSCPDVFETNGTSPPLDSFRRHAVGLLIRSQVASPPCVASDTVMCIDGVPGDQRFQVSVTYKTSQGGGSSGSGQEIPLAPLGVSHGGLMWFFDSTNPEMVLKILNGCLVNGKYWVFISAGTNVGFEVSITDTLFHKTVTYSNPDLTPAVPVQDVGALPGCV